MTRKGALINNFNKVRLAGANYLLRVGKAVHVNRDPAAVHKHEVRISDQPKVVRSVPLDKELFRMSPKAEHLTVARSEFFLVNRRRGLICGSYVGLTRGGASRLVPVCLLSATFNVRLSANVCAGLRFCLRLGLLLPGAHLFPLRGSSSLGILCLPLRLLWLLACLACLA